RGCDHPAPARPAAYRRRGLSVWNLDAGECSNHAEWRHLRRRSRILHDTSGHGSVAVRVSSGAGDCRVLCRELTLSSRDTLGHLDNDRGSDVPHDCPRGRGASTPEAETVAVPIRSGGTPAGTGVSRRTGASENVGTAEGSGPGGGCEPGKEGIPGQHEPRTADSAERHSRFFHAGARRAGLVGETAQRSGDYQPERRAPARSHRRSVGPVEQSGDTPTAGVKIQLQASPFAFSGDGRGANSRSAVGAFRGVMRRTGGCSDLAGRGSGYGAHTPRRGKLPG